jgi:threonine 3-dehydrogenase
VAVSGCGPIGLFSIAIARASGAGAIFAVDPTPYRRELAVAMGATEALDPTTGEIASIICEANEGYPVDIVLEMSGASSAITSAFKTVRNGGLITLFGIPSKPVEVDIGENMIFKNLTVFAINGRRIWDTCYKTRWLLEGGVVDLRPLITQEVDFKDVLEAFDRLADGTACKIVLRPGDAPTDSVRSTRETRVQDDRSPVFHH